jgi:hypothetical protein
MDSPEVLEDPRRLVDLRALQKVSYGTIGNGLGLESLVWPHDEYALAVTRKGNTPMDHTPALVECSPGRMNQSKLSLAQLDFLLVDGVEEKWLDWLTKTSDPSKPRVIL